MKIFVLTDVSGHGGAAMIANGLGSEWAKQNDVVRRYIIRHSGDKNPHDAIPSNRWVNFALHDQTKKTLGGAAVARWITRSLVISELEVLKPDVISIHNIHASNDNHKLVAACARIATVVWTLHDMWSFTGRCAHSGGCDMFIRGCDANCPSPDVRPALHPSKIAKAWSDRQHFFKSTPNLIGASPSQWLASLARQGLWQNHRMEVINNGVDTNVFKPIPQNSARQALGLPSDALVLTAYVGYKGDPFKTPELLEAALHLLETPVHVLTFGPGSLKLPARHTVIALGSIGSQRFLSIAYSCADIFVLPSAQENFPTVILEAAACGVPTVAFDIGGVAEIVKKDKSGWLVNSVTAKSLAKTITLSLKKAHGNQEMREFCRRDSENNFNISKQAGLYQSLFQELVGRG